VHFSALAVAITYNDEAVAIFGVVPESAQVGLVWLVGTPELSRHHREWVHHAEHHIQQMRKITPCLTNIVHEKNSTHRRWLHHFGFKRLGVEQHGPHQFIQFARMH